MFCYYKLKHVVALFQCFYFYFIGGYAFYPKLGCVRISPDLPHFYDAFMSCLSDGAHLVNIDPNTGHLHLQAYMIALGKQIK